MVEFKKRSKTIIPNRTIASADVAIIGGGIAGQSIARQLRLKMPDISITIIERNTFPLREAAIKVGESTVEMGAHYYSDILRLKPHLQQKQLPKLGLRYFFPSKDNSDITARFEMGSAQLPTPVPTYQIDRGRFENYLFELNKNNNINILEGCQVLSLEISSTAEALHSLIYSDQQHRKCKLNAKWLIDASGRFGIIKRKLELQQPVKHDCCAAWFRVGEVIDINTWSADSAWQYRSPLKQRKYSTNHLMGNGYWVWLIPLASNSTSIGVVYDPKLHSQLNFKTFESTLEWLIQNEPQLAGIIKKLENKLLDFRWLKQYAYSCKQIYSNDRWFLTGEAGVFADPFYSPGNDFIALSNTYITDLIYRDKQKQDISSRLKIYNDTYLNYFNLLLTHFEDQYSNFGNAYLMIEKILWDTICAFSIPYLIFIKNKFCDLEFMNKIGNEAINKYKHLTKHVQQYFKEGKNQYQIDQLENNYLNFSDLIHSKYYGGKIYRQLYKKLDEPTLESEIASNLKLMERLAHDITSGRPIIPQFYINGDGNKNNLWRVTKAQLTLALQNQWDQTQENITT